MMALKPRKETAIRPTLPRVVVLVDDGNDVEKGNGSDAAKKKTAGTTVSVSSTILFYSHNNLACLGVGTDSYSCV